MSKTDPNVPYGYCQCGCGQKTQIIRDTARPRGLVAGEPYRFVRGHGTRSSPVDYIEDPDSGCWVWQLSKDRGGYGAYQRGGRKVGAHRVFYEKHKGPIPRGLELDHLCRNRACVNPDHLEPVTRRENIMRGESFMAVRAKATHCERGHEFTPENTYVGRDGGRRCRECRRHRECRRRKALVP